MNKEENNQELFNVEMKEYISNLANKSLKVFEKSEEASNCRFDIDGLDVPLRVDDHQLLFIGMYLLPNIANYLVNILPQFIYPYVVAYLQDLSQMSTDPVTINDLYNLLIQENYGNILNTAETKD